MSIDLVIKSHQVKGRRALLVSRKPCASIECLLLFDVNVFLYRSIVLFADVLELMFILAVLTSLLLKLVGIESIAVSFIRRFSYMEFMAS